MKKNRVWKERFKNERIKGMKELTIIKSIAVPVDPVALKCMCQNKDLLWLTL